MKQIAIMQPTFLPWLGYFNLINNVDQFIFLNNVQFDKRSWQQRNMIKTPNGAAWITIPVKSKGKSNQLIKDVEILYEGNKSPLKKVLHTINQNYSNTEYFNVFSKNFSKIFNEDHTSLAHLNITLIKEICKTLGISERFTLASDLSSTGNKDKLLFNICKEVGATKYISPLGAQNYLEKSTCFQSEGITVEYMDYKHPEYSQKYGKFLPYMSIIDLIFNEGPKSMSILNVDNKKI